MTEPSANTWWQSHCPGLRTLERKSSSRVRRNSRSRGRSARPTPSRFENTSKRWTKARCASGSSKPDRDRGIRDKLLFAAKTTARADVASLRSVVRQATRISGFVDWGEASNYADRLADLAQMLEARVDDGDP